MRACWTCTASPKNLDSSDSVRNPCAIGAPNGPCFARSTSTWIHCWACVASANCWTWSWVMVSHSVVATCWPTQAARSESWAKTFMRSTVGKSLRARCPCGDSSGAGYTTLNVSGRYWPHVAHLRIVRSGRPEHRRGPRASGPLRAQCSGRRTPTHPDGPLAGHGARADVHAAGGYRIAADGWLLQAQHLQVDESLLTGESVPVGKRAAPEWPPEAIAPGGDDTPAVFAACHVVRGQGLAQVMATGARSQVGQIGAALAQAHEPPSPLQRQTAALVHKLAWGVAVLCLVMVFTLGLRHGDWLAAALSAIALAMALLPEEYPVVQTLFPALGARRLTLEGVLTRRINAIETLGAVSVLCTDKTGTLTQNQMTVTALAMGQAHAPQVLHWSGTALPTLAPQFRPLLEHAILASAPEPFDPMEHAFHRMGAEHLQDTGHLHGDWTLVHSYPLSPALPAMSHIWRTGEPMDKGNDHSISTKGAPEAVMALCHLGDADRQQWLATANQLAGLGLRVLGVARGQLAGTDFPGSPHDLNFEWLGLIGLTDPLRPDIQEAIAQCHSAGIRVIMITGDYPATARVIAAQAGLQGERLDGDVLTGDELARLDDAALRERR